MADIPKFEDRPTHGEGVTFTHKRPDLPGEATRTFKGRLQNGQQVWDIQAPESTSGGGGGSYIIKPYDIFDNEAASSSEDGWEYKHLNSVVGHIEIEGLTADKHLLLHDGGKFVKWANQYNVVSSSNLSSGGGIPAGLIPYSDFGIGDAGNIFNYPSGNTSANMIMSMVTGTAGDKEMFIYRNDTQFCFYTIGGPNGPHALPVAGAHSVNGYESFWEKWIFEVVDGSGGSGSGVAFPIGSIGAIGVKERGTVANYTGKFVFLPGLTANGIAIPAGAGYTAPMPNDITTMAGLTLNGTFVGDAQFGSSSIYTDFTCDQGSFAAQYINHIKDGYLHIYTRVS